MLLPIPNDQSLPVIRLTIVFNAVQVGDSLRARYVIRDNGSDFRTLQYIVYNEDQRESVRAHVNAEAMRRMRYYCSLGYAVEPWSIPS